MGVSNSSVKATSLLSLVYFLSNQGSGNLLDSRNISRINKLFETLASDNKMEYWAKYHKQSITELYDSCLRFIVVHIKANSKNSYGILFAQKGVKQPLHFYQKRYRLLMNIFHPDKEKKIPEELNRDCNHCASLIISAYKEVKQIEGGVRSSVDELERECVSTSRKKIKLVKRRGGVSKKIHPYLLLSLIFSFFSIFIVAYFLLSKKSETYIYKKPTIVKVASDEHKPQKVFKKSLTYE